MLLSFNLQVLLCWLPCLRKSQRNRWVYRYLDELSILFTEFLLSRFLLLILL